MRADRLRDLVERAVAGQTFGGRPIIVESVDNVDPGRPCHILYIGVGYGPDLETALARSRGAPTLTITDGVGDPARKGIINFVIERNRVRFEIDDQRAAENGLVISSKLLSLAVSVRSRR
jgi:hypothetical protein